MNFCTLFDSGYLDKGLALYQSLFKVTSEFTLYICCLDDKCYDILLNQKLDKVKLIHYQEIETPELLELKKTRSHAEYCWTCTSVVIEFVLEHYGLSECTYLDSDIYFFSDPRVLFMERPEADAIIVEHRFKKDKNYKAKINKYGKYCVQFNYFKNTENGRAILKKWKEQCFSCCSFKTDNGVLGDQKYLESWEKEFGNIWELRHLGGGVAPWNLGQYRLVSSDGYILEEMLSRKKFPIVFYHFQNINYITDTIVNIKSGSKDKKLKYKIYMPYLKQLEQNRIMLEQQYGLFFDRGRACSNKKWVAFIQKYIMKFKVTSFSDIINLRKLDEL